MKNYDPVLCRLWKLLHSCPLASSHYRMSFIARHILISKLLKCEKCASYNQWNIIINIQQMLDCLKYDSPPPDGPRVCASGSRLHCVLTSTRPANPVQNLIHYFYFHLYFSCPASLLTGNHPSHLCSVPMLSGLDFNPCTPQNRAREDFQQLLETCSIRPQRPA